MQHTTQCLQRYQERLDWIGKWPKFCQQCNGSGYIGWSENQAPIGSGNYWPEQFEEPCSKCLGQCRCPQCGCSWLPKRYQILQTITNTLIGIESWLEKSYRYKHFGVATKEYPLNRFKLAYNIQKRIRRARWFLEEKFSFEFNVEKCVFCDWKEGDSAPEFECYCDVTS